MKLVYLGNNTIRIVVESYFYSKFATHI